MTRFLMVFPSIDVAIVGRGLAPAEKRQNAKIFFRTIVPNCQLSTINYQLPICDTIILEVFVFYGTIKEKRGENMAEEKSPELGFGFAFDRFAKCKYPVLANLREYNIDHTCFHHRHDFAQIWYCYDGSYDHWIQGKTFRCEKGSLVVVPPGTVHDVFYDIPARVLNLNVSYDLILEACIDRYPNTAIQLFLGDFASEIDPDFTYYRMLSPEAQEIVETVFSWFMLLSYETHSTADNRKILAKLEEIFSLSEFALTQSKIDKALHIIQTRVIPIFKMVSFLNDHYGEKITEGQLLEGANISRAVMYRYFKRILGETYAVYLQKLRVRRAHIYMRTTTLHITQIAQICGFYDVCHLTKVYTKYLGTTPSQQRQFMRQIYGGCYKPQSAK